MADEQDHDAEALAALFAAMRLFLRRTANSIQGTEVSEGDVANAVAIALSQALVDDLFIAAYIESVEEPFYRAVLAAAQRQASALGISPDVVFDGDLLADAQRQIVRSGRFVLDTIRGDINDIIEAAVAEGLNADETMQRIAAKVSEQQRAMRIARTERGMAINTGNYAAATEAWRRGIVVGKRWNAILDDRVRDSHYLIHGETVRFDSLFSNGGRRPLDPTLPANEVINCRCVLSYVRYTDEAASSLLAAGGTFEGERWRGTLAVMDTPTADGRILIGTPTWRLLPLPLFFQPEQADAHSGAVQVGVIESIEVLDGNIIGEGYLFLNHPMYEAALTVIASRSGQLSIDPSEAEVVEMLDGSTGYLNPVLSGVTITAGPAAFDDTRIYLTASGLEIVDESVMVAAGLPKFKASAFVPRVFTKRTPLTVEGDVVYGHAAAWGTCHRGFAGTCRIVPRSKKNYSSFHLRRVGLDDGSFINVGALTAGSGHAPTSGVTNAQVTEHYDNVASVWAFVRCYEDRFGVAFVGQLLPDVDESFLLRAVGPLSGDWRKVDGNLELHALLSVPVPGFAVEESLVAAALPDEGDDDVLIADLGSVECEPCVTSALASLRLRLLRDKFGIKPLAAEPDHSDGIMIALMPEGNVSWSQIDPAHITIVYGGSVNDADAPDKTAMLASAAAIAARFSPVELTPIGVAQFGDEAVVATFDDGMLGEMRDVVEVFNRSQHLDFRPHLTISYGGELVDVESLTPVRFDRIELHYGDEVAALSLS